MSIEEIFTVKADTGEPSAESTELANTGAASQSNEPQAFELSFSHYEYANTWKQLAYKHARRLNIPIEFKTIRDSFTNFDERMATGKTSGVHSFYVAFARGQDYALLSAAMAPELQEYIDERLNRPLTPGQLSLIKEHAPDLHEKLRGEEAEKAAAALPEHNPAPSSPEQGSLTPSEQALLDRYAKELERGRHHSDRTAERERVQGDDDDHDFYFGLSR